MIIRFNKDGGSDIDLLNSQPEKPEEELNEETSGDDVEEDDDEVVVKQGMAALFVLNKLLAQTMNNANELLEKQEISLYERGMIFAYFDVLNFGKYQAKRITDFFGFPLLWQEVFEFDPYLLPVSEMKKKAKPNESPRATALLAEIVSLIKKESEGHMGCVDGMLAYVIMSAIVDKSNSCGVSLKDIGLDGFDLDSLL